MVERTALEWIAEVNVSPQDFCDLASARRLLAHLLDGEGPSHARIREDAINALARMVKASEDLDEDDQDARGARAAIRARIPDLLPGLLEETDNIDGCTISVLRRICPEAEHIATLLALLPDPPHANGALIIEALRLCGAQSWPKGVESRVAAYLPATPHAAGYTLYCVASELREAATTTALLRAAHPDANNWGRRYAVMALCCLLDGALASDAHEALHLLLPCANDETKVLLAETLGWAAKSGDELWALMQEDASAPLAAAIDAGRARRQRDVLRALRV